jgi:hypothetical protein
MSGRPDDVLAQPIIAIEIHSAKINAAKPDLLINIPPLYKNSLIIIENFANRKAKVPNFKIFVYYGA